MSPLGNAPVSIAPSFSSKNIAIVIAPTPSRAMEANASCKHPLPYGLNTNRPMRSAFICSHSLGILGNSCIPRTHRADPCEFPSSNRISGKMEFPRFANAISDTNHIEILLLIEPRVPHLNMQRRKQCYPSSASEQRSFPDGQHCWTNNSNTLQTRSI